MKNRISPVPKGSRGSDVHLVIEDMDRSPVHTRAASPNTVLYEDSLAREVQTKAKTNSRPGTGNLAPPPPVYRSPVPPDTCVDADDQGGGKIWTVEGCGEFCDNGLEIT